MAHYQPKVLVLYCDNDICGWKEGDLSIGEVFRLYKTFIAQIHTDYPNTAVFFLSIKHSLSRENLREQQQNLNEMMAQFASLDHRLTYVDVTNVLLDNHENINDALYMSDHLHLNSKGYDLWNSILKPLLMKQCKK